MLSNVGKMYYFYIESIHRDLDCSRSLWSISSTLIRIHPKFGRWTDILWLKLQNGILEPISHKFLSVTIACSCFYNLLINFVVPNNISTYIDCNPWNRFFWRSILIVKFLLIIIALNPDSQSSKVWYMLCSTDGLPMRFIMYCHQ